MNYKILIPAFLLFPLTSFSQTTFPLGNGLEKWGVPLKVPESELSIRLGARFQSLATIKKEEDLDNKTETTSQDFQSRRIRFQLLAELGTKASFYLDVRNDNANEGDGGERNFAVGDAYVSVPFSEGSAHSVRLYRAKVDLARTETVSSSELLFLNRPYIADEAAQFVSQNRRATNVQLNGNFAKKMTYQLVVGDGVFSDRFKDAKGKTVDDIEKQNFMLGGKFRFHPFEGWEDLKPTETYFGQGKHFSVGLGGFNTSNIRIVEAGNTGTVSRNLINAEMSAHFGEWSVSSEYFKMIGVIEDHSTANFNKGVGEGWYVQGEKVFSNFHFLAPFARYEKWDRFIESGDYQTDSSLFGVNWYLNGNRFRASLAYERDNLGRDISGSKERVEAFHLASMWHF